ncbi:MAG: DinB family protein [Balneolaceae bacterium]
MSKLSTFFLSLFLVSLLAVPMQAQDGMKTLFDGQFNYASRILELAETMSADTYSWRPEEEVRSVGEVYTHIAQANYMMLNSLGISAPEGVDVEALGSLTEKDEIVQALAESITFVLAAVKDLPEEKLSETVELFGRTTNGEGVLVFILNHTSEHVGQSIAYARINNVTPPWSE